MVPRPLPATCWLLACAMVLGSAAEVAAATPISPTTMQIVLGASCFVLGVIVGGAAVAGLRLVLWPRIIAPVAALCLAALAAAVVLAGVAAGAYGFWPAAVFLLTGALALYVVVQAAGWFERGILMSTFRAAEWRAIVPPLVLFGATMLAGIVALAGAYVGEQKVWPAAFLLTAALAIYVLVEAASWFERNVVSGPASSADPRGRLAPPMLFCTAALAGIAVLAGAYLGEYRFWHAAVFLLSGAIAIYAVVRAVALFEQGDGIEMQSAWGGLGGGLGGWRLSPATGLLLLALALVSVAVFAVIPSKPPETAEAAVKPSAPSAAGKTDGASVQRPTSPAPTAAAAPPPAAATPPADPAAPAPSPGR